MPATATVTRTGPAAAAGQRGKGKAGKGKRKADALNNDNNNNGDDDNEDGEQRPVRRAPKRTKKSPVGHKCAFCTHDPEGQRMDRETPCDWETERRGKAYLECTNCCEYRAARGIEHVCNIPNIGDIYKKYSSQDPMNYAVRTCDHCVTRYKSTCDVDAILGLSCTRCTTKKVCSVNGRPMTKHPRAEAGIAKWYRHACDTCSTRSKTMEQPCSWLTSRTNWGRACNHCSSLREACWESGLTIKGPDPLLEDDLPKKWTYNRAPGGGYLDVTTTTRSRRECQHCASNGKTCRMYARLTDHACNRCVSLGLNCIEPGTNRLFPIFDLSRVGFGNYMAFRSCTRCKEMGRNCDRQRPCDSCCNAGEHNECDEFDPTTSKSNSITGGACVRLPEGQAGELYYLALGYDGRGVNYPKDGTSLSHWIGPLAPAYGIGENIRTADQIQVASTTHRNENLPPQRPPHGGPSGDLDGRHPQRLTMADLNSFILALWPNAQPPAAMLNFTARARELLVGVGLLTEEEAANGQGPQPGNNGGAGGAGGAGAGAGAGAGNGAGNGDGDDNGNGDAGDGDGNGDAGIDQPPMADLQANLPVDEMLARQMYANQRFVNQLPDGQAMDQQGGVFNHQGFPGLDEDGNLLNHLIEPAFAFPQYDPRDFVVQQNQPVQGAEEQNFPAAGDAAQQNPVNMDENGVAYDLNMRDYVDPCLWSMLDGYPNWGDNTVQPPAEQRDANQRSPASIAIGADAVLPRPAQADHNPFLALNRDVNGEPVRLPASTRRSRWRASNPFEGISMDNWQPHEDGNENIGAVPARARLFSRVKCEDIHDAPTRDVLSRIRLGPPTDNAVEDGDNNKCMEPTHGCDGVCGKFTDDDHGCCSEVHSGALPGRFLVCDDCSTNSTRVLVDEGSAPITAEELVSLRCYLCTDCAETVNKTPITASILNNRVWGNFAEGLDGMAILKILPDAPNFRGDAAPITGCSCATKLLSHKLCRFHRLHYAEQALRQAALVEEWRLTRFGKPVCPACIKIKSISDSNVSASGEAGVPGTAWACLVCNDWVINQKTEPNNFVPGWEIMFGDKGMEPPAKWKSGA